MPNLPEYAICFHGVCAAGAVNTTSNPLYTARELHHQLHDSGARLLITVGPFLESAREAAADTGVEEVFVVGEGDARRRSRTCSATPRSGPSPTSSPPTTSPSSRTRGHHRAAQGRDAHPPQPGREPDPDQLALSPGPDDTLIAVLPFFHIYGQTVIMNLGLRVGGTIVTMPRFDLDQFLGLIAEHRVTRAYVVPPIALALAKHPAVDDADLSSVEIVMSGAAPLGAELADAVAERVGCPVMQGYGMTETSPVTHLVPTDLSKGRGGKIGLPLPDTECRMVDPETGEDADRGELWIRGPQVMSGYLGNEEATAATIDDEGWLHTGDVAEVDDEGHFAIVDRLKELIKYKGFQVPPAELEALLLTHPQVNDAAVIGIADEEAGELPEGVPRGRRRGLRRRDHRVRGRAGLPAEAHPGDRADRRDPEVRLGQDPPAHAGGARGPVGRREWPCGANE